MTSVEICKQNGWEEKTRVRQKGCACPPVEFTIGAITDRYVTREYDGGHVDIWYTGNPDDFTEAKPPLMWKGELKPRIGRPDDYSLVPSAAISHIVIATTGEPLPGLTLAETNDLFRRAVNAAVDVLNAQ